MQLLLIELAKKGGNDVLIETLKEKEKTLDIDIWNAEKKLTELKDERLYIDNAVSYLSIESK